MGSQDREKQRSVQGVWNKPARGGGPKGGGSSELRADLRMMLLPSLNFISDNRGPIREYLLGDVLQR